MLEAIDRHFEGIEFRERNAGGQIDEHMKDEGGIFFNSERIKFAKKKSFLE